MSVFGHFVRLALKGLNDIESWGYDKSYGLNSTRPIKCSNKSIRHYYQKIYNRLRKVHIALGNRWAYYLQVFKRLTMERSDRFFSGSFYSTLNNIDSKFSHIFLEFQRLFHIYETYLILLKTKQEIDIPHTVKNQTRNYHSIIIEPLCKK